jgi:hypothetical protein
MDDSLQVKTEKLETTEANADASTVKKHGWFTRSIEDILSPPHESLPLFPSLGSLELMNRPHGHTHANANPPFSGGHLQLGRLSHHQLTWRGESRQASKHRREKHPESKATAGSSPEKQPDR